MSFANFALLLLLIQYPVVTAHIPYTNRRWNMPSDSGLITTATNQAVLRPQLVTKATRKKSKGKKKATENGTSEETEGLIKKVPDLLDRINSSDSSSSHMSDRSGVVDLVVEDKQAEEVERVRARKEGGPAWNSVEPKRYVRQYPPDKAGEEIREGFEPEVDPPVDNRAHKTDESKPDEAREAGAFVVAEDEDDKDSDTEEQPQNTSRHRYGSMAAEHNPWGDNEV